MYGSAEFFFFFCSLNVRKKTLLRFNDIYPPSIHDLILNVKTILRESLNDFSCKWKPMYRETRECCQLSTPHQAASGHSFRYGRFGLNLSVYRSEPSIVWSRSGLSISDMNGRICCLTPLPSAPAWHHLPIFMAWMTLCEILFQKNKRKEKNVTV